MKSKQNYYEKLEEENEKLSGMFANLQERYLRQEKILDRAIAFIEMQSGAKHCVDLYFERPGRKKLPNFRINTDGNIII